MITVHHNEDDAPAPPRIHHYTSLLIIGDSAVVADGPKTGDIIVKIQDRERSYGYFYTDNVFRYTQFDYWLVQNVTKPDGVCHGHSLLTLKPWT